MPPMSADEFVTLEALHDPTRAAMLEEILREAGIPVHVLGLEQRRLFATVGATSLIQLRVPRSHLAEAEELVQAIEAPDAVLEPVAPPEPPPGAGPYRGATEPREDYGDPRLKRVSFFCALLLTFGTGHFYAREKNTGWLLLLLEAVGFAGAFLGMPRLGAAVPALILYDAFGSLGAVDRFNAGAPRSEVAQLKRAPLVLAVAALGVFLGPHVDALLTVEDPAAEAAETPPAPAR